MLGAEKRRHVRHKRALRVSASREGFDRCKLERSRKTKYCKGNSIEHKHERISPSATRTQARTQTFTLADCIAKTLAGMRIATTTSNEYSHADTEGERAGDARHWQTVFEARACSFAM